MEFLLLSDLGGIVEKVFWSRPSEPDALLGHSFLERFLEEERSDIASAMERMLASRTDHIVAGMEPIEVRSGDARLILLPVDDRLLVLSVGPSSDDGAFQEHMSVRHQFELIQKLNNELVNTKRQLEKSNAQLNFLNAELNNRLVQDPLTGLVSRYQYRAEIDYLIARNLGKLGVFTFMDIDGFKAVNDTYGHKAGDRYLVEFAERLNRIPVENTVKMRISGDEFGLFTYGLDRVGPEVYEDLWNRLADCVLRNPIVVDGVALSVSVSAGMATYGIDTDDVFLLIDYADRAMYEAKRHGKNRFRVYDGKEAS